MLGLQNASIKPFFNGLKRKKKSGKASNTWRGKSGKPFRRTGEKDRLAAKTRVRRLENGSTALNRQKE